MKKIKKGDIVARKSYGKDIIFYVKRIIKTVNGEIAILYGLIKRIEADSRLDDLEILDKEVIKKRLEKEDEKINNRAYKRKDEYKIGIISNENTRLKEKIITGKILHLDGDRRYSQKSIRYYKNLSLNAVVKNIPEYRQSLQIRRLLMKYNPDILVVTGHDAMLKNGKDYNNIYNYRNSRYFVETVKEARKYKKSKEELVIFAGACQSYFEEIMKAGANFASSPGRILIDFIDPLIVAGKVALTDSFRYITIEEIAKELTDGIMGIGGTMAKGKKQVML